MNASGVRGGGGLREHHVRVPELGQELPWPGRAQDRGVDADRASRLLPRQAEEALSNRAATLDYAKAQAELAIAVAQIAALRRLQRR
jgi:hypothetical protein